MTGLEVVVIDRQTRLRDFKNTLRWNQASAASFRRSYFFTIYFSG